MDKPRTLEIRLIDQRVGWLVQRDGRHGIRFNQSWRELPNRRVFSLSVENTGLQDVRATPHLPTWFENVLFEGEMRRWITASEPDLGGDNMSLLARIGQDLIGAVTLHAVDDEVPISAPVEVAEARRSSPGGGIRWSLAGVQLKLNLALRGERFTLPVHGEPGHFIAKFADLQYRGVPLNEHATMRWASAAGIEVAETELIDGGRIDELPAQMRRSEEPVLLVRRFDRDGDRRIHVEEFAQILDLRPSEKYQRFGWRHHLKTIATVAPDDIAQYLRRLLFVIASGNADAHHKNWSLIYPDGRRPRLAPAYDQVSIVSWLGENPELADSLPFKLAGSKRWEDLRRSSLERLLEEVGVRSFVDDGTIVDAASFAAWVKTQLERIQDTLPVAQAIVGDGYARSIERHWSRTPLLRG